MYSVSCWRTTSGLPSLLYWQLLSVTGLWHLPLIVVRDKDYARHFVVVLLLCSRVLPCHLPSSSISTYTHCWCRWWCQWRWWWWWWWSFGWWCCWSFLPSCLFALHSFLFNRSRCCWWCWRWQCCSLLSPLLSVHLVLLFIGFINHSCCCCCYWWWLFTFQFTLDIITCTCRLWLAALTSSPPLAFPSTAPRVLGIIIIGNLRSLCLACLHCRNTIHTHSTASLIHDN